MKLLTKEDAEAYRQATINGGFRGALLGAAISVPAHFLLQRRANYRAIPITLKALGYVCIMVPCISITAEKAGEAYERSRWTGVGQRELARAEQRKEEHWEGLSAAAKVRDWGARHKWGMIAGAWAGSMALAFGIVARTPQTFSQKLVQARMWAQGLTVGTLLSSAVIAGVHTTDNVIVEGQVDHSWADLLEQEGQLKKEDLDKIRGQTAGTKKPHDH